MQQSLIWSLLTDLGFVLQTNLYVLGLMLVGGLSFGFVTFLILIWNSLFLGFHLHSVLAASAIDTVCGLLYIPLEFFALCFMATGAEALGFWIFRYLVLCDSRTSHRFGQIVLCCIISLGLALVAGVMEVGAKCLRNYAGGWPGGQ